jgi:beta-phosphoglucomutase-like phosphatase (HAD superfamily)/uncharacterized protein with PQ loop repeat
MIETTVNHIFIAGWYITAILFSIQAIKVFQTKDGRGVSSIATLGFFVLNINSSIWMYLHQEYVCIIATSIVALASLASFIGGKIFGNVKAKYLGVIFDLDGMLFNSQTPIHATAECAVLAEHNISIKPEEISARFAGISTRRVFQELAPQLDPELLLEEKWRKVHEILEQSEPEPIEGMDRLLAFLTLNKVKISIASASPKWYIELFLEKYIDVQRTKIGYPFRNTKLKKYFGKNYVSAEEVTEPKPSPDVFLEAARRLGVDPKRCLVIGDGKSDALGATAAGMDALFFGNADEEIDNLKNVLSFSASKDLASYLIKQENLF